MGKFQELRGEWNRLSTEAEKVQWLKDNQTEMQKLGLKVNDVTSAENVFNRNTPKIVKALELRARAMAAQGMIIEQYKKYYETIMAADQSVAGGGFYNQYKKGGGAVGVNGSLSDEAKAAGVTSADLESHTSTFTSTYRYIVCEEQRASAPSPHKETVPRMILSVPFWGLLKTNSRLY